MARTILHFVGQMDVTLRQTIPTARWTLLASVAVGGSLLYGASLALVLPGWTLGGAALWLTLSAGLAWCLFIPALWLVTARPLVPCIDASLVTMAAGEVILTSGALMNVLIRWQSVAVEPALINACVVGISNVVMAAVVALQLRRDGVSIGQTIALWMLVLNGSGAVFFVVLRQWLSTP